MTRRFATKLKFHLKFGVKLPNILTANIPRYNYIQYKIESYTFARYVYYREEVSSVEGCATSGDKNVEKSQKSTHKSPPPLLMSAALEESSSDSAQSNTLHQPLTSSLHSQQGLVSTSLLATSHDSDESPTSQSQESVLQSHPLSPTPSPSVSQLQSQLISVSTSGRARGSVTASKPSQLSPIMSSGAGNSRSNNSSSSISGGDSAPSSLLFSQADTLKGTENNNMLTLSSYVQFMTLVSLESTINNHVQRERYSYSMHKFQIMSI